MFFRIGLRAIVVGAMTASAVAIMVARTEPRPARFRTPRVAHRSTFGNYFCGVFTRGSQVVDTATGEVSDLPLPRRNQLEHASFSDWVDERGEWQVVGRWSATQVSDSGRVLLGLGLARFAYPSGRMLDHIEDCPLPASAPCWFPGVAPRVLFPSTDGHLYQCTFDEEALGCAAKADVRQVSWTKSGGPQRDPAVMGIVWPEGLNGYLIAALRQREPWGSLGPPGLWWLRLSASGLAVTRAGPLLVDDSKRNDFVEYWLPNVVSLPRGSDRIAYLRRCHPRTEPELFVARVRMDSDNGVPSIEAANAQKVADHLMITLAAFSPDGAWLYALQKTDGGPVAIRRFPVHWRGD